MSTYTPIATQVLSSATATITFAGIPQNYTDLVLVASRRFSNTGTGNQNSLITFNGDSGSNYSQTYMANPTSSGQLTNQTTLYTSGPGNEDSARYSADVWNFFNYSNTTTFKTSIFNMQFANQMNQTWVNLWRSTSAITSINITAGGGALYAAGSTFNLYGIASTGIATSKATGGDFVYSDGTYWYHQFTSSGVFTPLQALTVDYLVVAGGGGSGTGSVPGGGGAGGLRCTVGATGGGGSLESPLSLTAQNYTVTIGAGGTQQQNGTNSVFATITSLGGGNGAPGGCNSGNAAFVGGSGGGGGSSSKASGAAGTANQGYGGGNGIGCGSPYASGGGGGAGAAGASASGSGGQGGIGISTSITGSSNYYAGGGGGGILQGYTPGSGGLGGGGLGEVGLSNGYLGTAATNGAPNTGGGAGGGRYGLTNSPTGTFFTNGGSGIVVVRYAV
jgi:hypothetical protein